MGIFTRTATSQPFHARRGLTAAAVTLRIDDADELDRIRRRRTADSWQDDAWAYYDAIGEVKFAFNFMAAVMSRVKLYAGAVIGEDSTPSHARDVADLEPGLAEAAAAIMTRLGSGAGGVPGLLSSATLNLSVAGECYLVQTPARVGSRTPESWRVRSVDEVVIPRDSSSAIRIKASSSLTQSDLQDLPPGSAIGRIWRMHPRYSDEADSSLRGLLDLMDELLLLNRTARATAKSRLNAGLLFVPDGLSAAYTSDGQTPSTEVDPDIIAAEGGSEADEFEEQLIDAMTTPIADESSASAVVPLIVRGPDQLGEKIKLIKFERSFDPQLQSRADRVLERILMGLDLPKDLVTGLASAKYANAVHIEETLYKGHIEPLCLLICDSLTEVFLKPCLRARGYTDEQLERIVVWYDPSEITTKPDKASAATQGYEMRALSGEAWRRSNGFTDADAPSNMELLARIVEDRGVVGEPLSESIFRWLNPELLRQIRQQQLASSPSPLPQDVQDLVGGDSAASVPNTSAAADSTTSVPDFLAEPTQ